MSNKLDKEYCSIKATKELLKLNPEISVDQVKGYDRRARASPFIMEHVKIIQTLTDEIDDLQKEKFYLGFDEDVHEIVDKKYIEKLKEEIDDLKAENERILDRGSQVASDLFIENEKLKAEIEKLKAKNEHEKEAVREYHKLHVADTYICGNGICKGKTYEEAKRIIIDKEGYEYWELWRKRVNWEFCN